MSAHFDSIHLFWAQVFKGCPILDERWHNQFASSTTLPQGEVRHQLLFRLCYPQTQIYYRTFLVLTYFISARISSSSPHQDNPKSIPNHLLQGNFSVYICDTLQSWLLQHQDFGFFLPSSFPLSPNPHQKNQNKDIKNHKQNMHL